MKNEIGIFGKYSMISIDLDNGLAPNRRQVIIWTNADPASVLLSLNGAIFIDKNLKKSSTFNNKPCHQTKHGTE